MSDHFLFKQHELGSLSLKMWTLKDVIVKCFSFWGMLSIVFFSTQEITVSTKGANHRVLLKGGNITHEIYNLKMYSKGLKYRTSCH